MTQGPSFHESQRYWRIDRTGDTVEVDFTAEPVVQNGQRQEEKPTDGPDRPVPDPPVVERHREFDVEDRPRWRVERE